MARTRERGLDDGRYVTKSMVRARKRELGTANTPPPKQPEEGTGLVGEGRKKKKFKKRKKAEKTEKYKSEGACSYHGSKCSHARSADYTVRHDMKSYLTESRQF